SALTLYHLLLFRLRFDPAHLSRASVGGLEAMPGPNSYVFDSSLFALTSHEHFVDGGAYRGETFERFLTASPEGTVHAFEPDPVNLAYCRAKALELRGADFERRIMLDGRALWDRAGRLHFSSQDYQASRRAASHLLISDRDEGGTSVPVVALDDVLEQVPTFLKLELEGAETWAVRGAATTIARHRPKLSIGVYHRPLDMLEVIRQLADMRADYRLYLRHHTPSDWVATVCYGVPLS
ncbi:MAG TPA: FkbM family methyltransferase, partial [Polyangiales bacterium]|nr:FkbM family methyltransferase [Polyangiales bacterium]